jgi:hypothetical protein
MNHIYRPRITRLFIFCLATAFFSGPTWGAEDIIKFTGELHVKRSDGKTKVDAKALLFEVSSPATKDAPSFQVCDPKAPLSLILAELSGVQMEVQGYYSSSATQGSCFVPEGFRFSAFFGTSYRYVFGSLREKDGKWWIETSGGVKQTLTKPVPGLRQLRNQPTLVMAHPDGTTLHYWRWQNGAERFLR